MKSKNPADYINRLVLYAGNKSEFGDEFSISRHDCDDLGGNGAVSLCFRYLIENGFISDESVINERRGRLTAQGWKEYNRIKSGNITGTTAFLAHQFGDPSIAQAMQTFAKVCATRGYTPVDLETDASVKAGRISDRIELEIKLSRFVIADLTNGNNGAYWEAGFAAGLGRKVIYTCREDFFDAGHVHFDVSSHTLIKWNPDDLSDAASRFDYCIRNTFAETG